MRFGAGTGGQRAARRPAPAKRQAPAVSAAHVVAALGRALTTAGKQRRYSVPTAQPDTRSTTQRRASNRTAAAALLARTSHPQTEALFSAALNPNPKPLLSLRTAAGGAETALTEPGKLIQKAFEADPTGLINPKTAAEFPEQARRLVRGYLHHPTARGALDVALATGPLAGEVGGKGPEGARIERPRTRAEAEQLLAEIDKANEGLVAKLAEQHPNPAAEQLRRNRINGLIDLFEKKGQRRAGTAKALRAGRQPSVSEEGARYGQQALEHVLARHPEHPVVKAYLAREAHANSLREMLGAPEDPFATTERPRDFGTVSEPAVQPPRRLRAARQLRLPLKTRPLPTVVSPEQRVAESLGPARARRAAQEGLYREERAKRIARARAASERAGGGEAGFAAAKEQLRGELPKVKFRHLREGTLGQDEFESLLTQVQNHPGLQWYDKIHAQQGLADAFREGKVPQRSQIKHLQTVFGQDAADEIVKTSRLVKAGRVAMNVLNIPRSLMASYDLSAPFRQGLVAGVSHPGMFFKNFAPMVKSFGSDRYYRTVMDHIEQRPNLDLYHQSGLKLTDLSKEAGHREEQFPPSYAEKIPAVGHGVRASARAYTGFLNKMRADLFDRLMEQGRKKGVNVEDRHFQRSIAAYVNSATGRGSLGPIESWGPALNTLFFSPRLAASRINTVVQPFNPALHPFARREAQKSLAKLAGFGGAAGALGSAAGGAVGVDPRSSDFGKLRFGHTRLDPLGGFAQYAVAAARLGSGQSISSTTGKLTQLGPGMGQISRKDIAERFFAGKSAPAVSALYEVLNGKDFQGQPLSVKTEVLNRVIPLAIQDAYSLEHDTKSIPLGVAGYAASGLGIGLQTYAPTDVGRHARGKIQDERHLFWQETKRVAPHALEHGRLPLELRRAFDFEAKRQAAIAKARESFTIGTREYQLARYKVEVALLRQTKQIDSKTAREGLAWAKTASTERLKSGNTKITRDYWSSASRRGQLYLIAFARKALNERGAKLP